MQIILLITILIFIFIIPSIVSQETFPVASGPATPRRDARENRAENRQQYTIEMTDTAAAEAVRFQKQCFLSTHMGDILLQIKEMNSPDPTIRGNEYSIILGSAPEVTSAFNTREGLETIFSLTPAQLALLVPSVRIFKVQYESYDDATNSTGMEVEFKFDANTSKERIDNIMETGRGRGGGVGLKSFIWKKQGVNPAEVENNIRATLKLYFNDIRDFDGIRGAGRESYRFADLILPEHLRGRGANENREYNPNFFRIKAVVGWSVPRTAGELIDENTRRKIETNKTVLFLNLLSHDIDFDDSGAIELTAQYQAYTEGLFASKEADIFQLERIYEKLVLPFTDPEGNLRSTTVALQQEALERETRGELGYMTALRSQRQDCVGWDDDDTARQEVESREALVAARRISIDRLSRRTRAFVYDSFIRGVMTGGNIYAVTVDTQRDLGLDFGTEDENYPWASGTGTNMPEAEELDRSIQAENFRRWSGRRALGGGLDFTVRRPSRGRIHSISNETGGLARSGPRAHGEARFGSIADLLEITDISKSRLGIDREIEENAGYDAAYRRSETAAEALDMQVNSQDDLEAEIAAWRNRVVAPFSSDQNQGLIPINFILFGDLLDVVLTIGKDLIIPEDIEINPRTQKTLTGFGERTANMATGASAGVTGINERHLLGNYFERNNVRIALGSFLFTDPITGQEATIPLASVPISLELFSSWFLENIIVPQKTRYPFRRFVRDVFNNLVAEAIGGDCIESDFIGSENEIQLGSETYSISKEHADREWEDPYGETGQILQRGSIVPVRELRAIPFAETNPIGGLWPEDEFIHVQLFQPMEQRARFISNRSIVPVEGESVQDIVSRDFNDGIYHFNIGSNRGLVKRIKFKRNDQDYYREARLERAGELGALSQLRERYNADVYLYGNSFFSPGQYVYINPTMIGFNNYTPGQAAATIVDSSLPQELGLGGYFVVIHVETVLERGTFETKLDCRWVHSGFLQPALECGEL